MMSKQSAQMQIVILDYNSIIPEKHILKQIDSLINFDFIYDITSPFYSNTGRKFTDPVVMIKMLLIEYLFGIKPERRLEEEISLNFAYRWFCGIQLNERVPDHYTFSQNRKRRFKDDGIFRNIFNKIVYQCNFLCYCWWRYCRC